MDEYIKRGALIEKINREKWLLNSAFPKRKLCVGDVLDCIFTAPAADVVEVVRCKDCRHKNELNKYEKTIYADGCVACSFISATGDRLVMLGDAFCNYGEKMDGKGE